MQMEGKKKIVILLREKKKKKEKKAVHLAYVCGKVVLVAMGEL